MKVIKSYIPVTDLVTGLKDEYAKQVKCAYFNDVKYNRDFIEFTVAVDDEDGTDEEIDITEVTVVSDEEMVTEDTGETDKAEKIEEVTDENVTENAE